MRDVSKPTDAVTQMRKHAEAAENLYTRHNVSNPFFAASVNLANMWAAVASAEVAVSTLNEILQTGAPDNS